MVNHTPAHSFPSQEEKDDPLSFLEVEQAAPGLRLRSRRSASESRGKLVTAGVTLSIVGIMLYVAQANGLIQFVEPREKAVDATAPAKAAADQGLRASPETPQSKPSGASETTTAPSPKTSAEPSPPPTTPSPPADDLKQDPSPQPDPEEPQPAPEPDDKKEEKGFGKEPAGLLSEDEEASTPEHELDEARQAYIAKIQELENGVMAALQAAEYEAKSAKDESKLEQVQEARDLFEKQGKPPTTFVSTRDYERARTDATEALEFAYRKAYKDLVESGEEKAAKDLIEEFDQLTAVSEDDRMLRKRGLFRSGKYYIVPGVEANVLAKFPETNRLYRSMAETVGQIQQVLENDQAIVIYMRHWDMLVAEIRRRQDVLRVLPNNNENRQLIANLNAEIKQLRVGPVPGPTLGDWPGLDETEGILDFRIKNCPGPPARRELLAEFHRRKEPYVVSLGELRHLVNEMNQKYTEYHGDPQVENTLKGMSLLIGPSGKLRKIASALVKAEKEIKNLDATVKLPDRVFRPRRFAG